jgi:polyhydroxybutyrate depolymerase
MRSYITKALRFCLIFGLATAGSSYRTDSRLSAQTPMPKHREWLINEATREALIAVPAEATTKACPVVFAFHGHGGTMAHASTTFGYHKHWPEAIVVYMQGLKTPGKLTDPEGKRSGWQSTSGDQNDRDLKFFDQVLSTLKQEYRVDETRIYSTGHSNGGGFTYLLAETRGSVFAAIAPSAAVPGKGWRDLKPIPILHVAGENDHLVKFDWQKRTIQALLKLNECDAEGQPWDKSGNLIGTIYASKSKKPVVTLISSANHKFPQEAPPLIVKFFKEHVKTAN